MKKGLGKMLIPLIGISISFFIAWFILDSLLLGLVYGILVLLGIMFLQKAAAKKQKFYHDIESAYNFVNLMNIQMLSTNSTYEAYEGITNYLDVDFANITSMYLLTGRERPCYVGQTPSLLTDLYSQECYLRQIEEHDCPLAVLGTTETLVILDDSVILVVAGVSNTAKFVVGSLVTSVF